MSILILKFISECKKEFVLIEVKKSRSKEVTLLFNSYRNTNRIQNSEQLVWFTEKDQHRKKGKLCVGHTKCYTKVTVPFDESLMGTCVRMQITECQKWHVEGDILERNIQNAKPAKSYFDIARERLIKKKKMPKSSKKKLSASKAAKLLELVDLEADSESEESDENSLQSPSKKNKSKSVAKGEQENDSSKSQVQVKELQAYMKLMTFVEQRNWFGKLALIFLFLGALLKIFDL